MLIEKIKSKKRKIILIVSSIVVFLSLLIIGILWYQNRIINNYDEIKKYRASMDAYMKVINTGDRRFLEYIPEYILNLATHEKVPLRQAAENFLIGTEGTAINMGGFFLIEPRKKQLITNPVKLKLWHKSSYYEGGIIQITDANNKLLAEYHLPKISYFNIIYHYYETEIIFEEPATTEGFIVGYLWSMKDEEDILEEDRKYYRIPIIFSTP